MITANHNAPHRRQQWGTVILRFKQLWSRYESNYTTVEWLMQSMHEK